MVKFNIEEFRKGLEDRLAHEESERQKMHDERRKNETDGYIRCLKNILFMLPPKAQH